MMDDTYQAFQRQIADLTRLAAAQIRVGIVEAEESVNQITDSFTDIVNQDRTLRELVETLPEEPDIIPIKHAITSQSNGIGGNVRNAIIAFQFFDRLCQRLDHSIECLKELSAIEESDYLQHMTQLTQLKELIYQRYTMEEERILYDELLNNSDFTQAIETYLNNRAKNQIDDDDDVELF